MGVETVKPWNWKSANEWVRQGGCTCSNCEEPPERIVTSSRLWDRVNAVYCTTACISCRNTDEAVAHPSHNPTLWKQVFHTHPSQQWRNWWVVKKKMVGNVLLFSHSTCLRALNCLFSISGGGLETAKDREASRGNGEREGERAWVKVIIWITAGNWITLHRGKLISQKWVEMKLDRWVHILHTSQWAVEFLWIKHKGS